MQPDSKLIEEAHKEALKEIEKMKKPSFTPILAYAYIFPRILKRMLNERNRIQKGTN